MKDLKDKIDMILEEIYGSKIGNKDAWKHYFRTKIFTALKEGLENELRELSN